MLWLLALAGAERGINHVLALDATAKPRLARLSGKVLAVRAHSPAFELYVLPSADGLTLASQWQGEVSCTMIASTQDLLRLAKSPEKTHVLHGSEFVIEGDTTTLLDLATIVQSLELDFDFALSQWLGPVATHLVGSTVRRGIGWGTSSVASIAQTLSDYVAEESRMLVGNAEAQYRFQEIDDLKLSLERLEARVARLTTDSSENA